MQIESCCPHQTAKALLHGVLSLFIDAGRKTSEYRYPLAADKKVVPLLQRRKASKLRLLFLPLHHNRHLKSRDLFQLRLSKKSKI